MGSPKWKCEGCHKLVKQLSYCSECWKVVCDECYDEFVGTCKECIEKLFDGTITRRSEIVAKNDYAEAFRKPISNSIPQYAPEQMKAHTAERERNYRLARGTKRCPKCKDWVSLIELANESLFCPKCNSIFTPRDDVLFNPLGSSPAGNIQWSGTIDNNEKTIERDNW